MAIYTEQAKFGPPAGSGLSVRPSCGWLLAMMLCLPGCGGCRKTPEAEEQEKQQAEEKAKKKKEKEKEPFEAQKPAVMPSGKDSCRVVQAGPLDQPGLARREGQSRRLSGRTADGDRR